MFLLCACLNTFVYDACLFCPRFMRCCNLHSAFFSMLLINESSLFSKQNVNKIYKVISCIDALVCIEADILNMHMKKFCMRCHIIS